MRIPWIFLLIALGLQSPARAEPLHVFAAASLKTAIDEINVLWQSGSGLNAVGIYAASPALARQITDGAPADIFISADQAWMDDLEAHGLTKPETRHDLIGNTLVLIAPTGSGLRIELTPGADLLKLLGGRRLAIGETTAVPAGRYAKAALQSLGLWDGLSPHLAEQINARAALQLVARGECPLGIVYGSDATAESQVEVAGYFPRSLHPPIIYPVAIIAASRNPAAAEYLAFLNSDAAANVFWRNGFIPLK